MDTGIVQEIKDMIAKCNGDSSFKLTRADMISPNVIGKVRKYMLTADDNYASKHA